MAETQRLASADAPGYDATAASPEAAAPEGPGNPPGASSANDGPSWAFPFEPFRFVGELAPGKYKYVPTYVKVIHSFPHLVLLVGTCATILIMVRIVIEYENWYSIKHSNADIAVLMSCFVFGLFALQQLFKQLVDYSADLQTRSAQLQKSKDQVTQTFNQTVTDLDTMLNKAADTQASLAERSLDAQRRDFHGFLLKGMSRRLAHSAATSLELFNVFTSFVVFYLSIFRECAVDPIEDPYLLASEEELRGTCSSAVGVAELVGNRAKAKEVIFLSGQVEEAKKKSSLLRKKWKKVTVVPKKVLKLTGLSRFIKKKKSQQPVDRDEEQGSFGSFQVDEADGAPRELKWFRFEAGCGLGVETEEEEFYPVQVHGYVFTCTVLSPEHVRMLVCVVVGVPLLFLSVVAVTETSRALIGAMGVSLGCIFFVLYDFLEIDAVQRMEIQIQEMQAAVTMVQQRREKMLEFFGRVGQLSDLWLFRTLPRLEMMKAFGEALQDADDAELGKLLQDIVLQVGMLEESMTPLSAWVSDELPRETKQKVADAFTRLSRDPGGLADHVPSTVKELSELKAAASAMALRKKGRAESAESSS